MSHCVWFRCEPPSLLTSFRFSVSLSLSTLLFIHVAEDAAFLSFSVSRFLLFSGRFVNFSLLIYASFERSFCKALNTEEGLGDKKVPEYR